MAYYKETKERLSEPRFLLHFFLSKTARERLDVETPGAEITKPIQGSFYDNSFINIEFCVPGTGLHTLLGEHN